MGHTKDELDAIDDVLTELAGSTEVVSAAKLGSHVGTLEDVDVQLSELGSEDLPPRGVSGAAVSRSDSSSDADPAGHSAATAARQAQPAPEMQPAPELDAESLDDGEFELLVDDEVLEVVLDD